ncbi:transcription-repair coupling factor [Actinobacillus pleuropneumoniae]|nr:transcription-repair coupling factor [Actinobacillus pleuropneumoniae]
MTFHFNLNLPEIGGKYQDHQTLGNLIGHADTLVIAQATEQFNGLSVVVTPDTRTALRLEKALMQFSKLPVSVFPDWETLPYDNFSPHQDIISARLSALFHLQQGNKQIFLLPINTLLQKVCPPSYLANNVLLIKKAIAFQFNRYVYSWKMPVIVQWNKCWNTANMPYVAHYLTSIRWERKARSAWIFLMMKSIRSALSMRTVSVR